MDTTPSSYLVLEDAIGEEAAKALCRAFGGEALYIPKIETLEKISQQEAIRKAYNGANVRQLAKQYNLTPRRVQQIVENERPVLPGQVTFFGGQDEKM